jgi:hypothetical protein
MPDAACGGWNLSGVTAVAACFALAVTLGDEWGWRSFSRIH